MVFKFQEQISGDFKILDSYMDEYINIMTFSD